MTAEDEQVQDGEMVDNSATENGEEGGGGDAPKKQKRSKPRRQSGTAVAFQKRTSVRKLPERTTSSHLVERKGKNQLQALQGVPKQDRRGSQGAIKAANSAMRAARGVPKERGVSRAASSQQAPRRPDRDVRPLRRLGHLHQGLRQRPDREPKAVHGPGRTSAGKVLLKRKECKD